MQTGLRVVASVMAVYGYGSNDLFLLLLAVLLWEFAGGMVATFIFFLSGLGKK